MNKPWQIGDIFGNIKKIHCRNINLIPPNMVKMCFCSNHKPSSMNIAVTWEVFTFFCNRNCYYIFNLQCNILLHHSKCCCSLAYLQIRVLQSFFISLSLSQLQNGASWKGCLYCGCSYGTWSFYATTSRRPAVSSICFVYSIRLSKRPLMLPNIHLMFRRKFFRDGDIIVQNGCSSFVISKEETVNLQAKLSYFCEYIHLLCEQWAYAMIWKFLPFFADVITTSQVFEAILKLCEHIITTQTTTAIVVDGGDGGDVMVPIECKCYSIIYNYIDFFIIMSKNNSTFDSFFI